MAEIKYLSTGEAADILGLNKKTIQKMCKEGRLKAVKQSDRKQSWWKVPESAIGYCKICGKPFPVSKERKVYCSDQCVKEGNRQKALAYWRKMHPPKADEPEDECECEQLCMDLPEPLPFEPEPPRMPEMVDMQKLYDDLCNGFALFFEHLAEGMAEIAKGLKK